MGPVSNDTQYKFRVLINTEKGLQNFFKNLRVSQRNLVDLSFKKNVIGIPLTHQTSLQRFLVSKRAPT